jgi:hypothetical protein
VSSIASKDGVNWRRQDLGIALAGESIHKWEHNINRVLRIERRIFDMVLNIYSWASSVPKHLVAAMLPLLIFNMFKVSTGFDRPPMSGSSSVAHRDSVTETL